MTTPTMPLTADEINSLPAGFDQREAALLVALDPEARAQRVAELFKECLDKGAGYFSRAEQRRIHKGIDEEQAQFDRERADVAWFYLNGYAREHRPRLEATKARAMEAPTLRSLIPTSDQTSGLLRDLLQATLEPAIEARVKGLLPGALLAEYEAALRDPMSPRSAVLIEVTERLHRETWSGRPADNKDELAAALKLRERIRHTREGRIPPALVEALARCERAFQTLRRVTQVHGIQGRRPVEAQ